MNFTLLNKFSLDFESLIVLSSSSYSPLDFIISFFSAYLSASIRLRVSFLWILPFSISLSVKALFLTSLFFLSSAAAYLTRSSSSFPPRAKASATTLSHAITGRSSRKVSYLQLAIMFFLNMLIFLTAGLFFSLIDVRFSILEKKGITF